MVCVKLKVLRASLLNDDSKWGGVRGASFCVEPSSALALAGLKSAQGQGLADRAGFAVCVMTSSGLNWIRDLHAVWDRFPDVLESPAAVRGHAAPATEVATEASTVSAHAAARTAG